MKNISSLEEIYSEVKDRINYNRFSEHDLKIEIIKYALLMNKYSGNIEGIPFLIELLKEKDFTILVAYGIEHTANNINGTEKDRDLLSSAINPLIRILKDKEFISSYHSNLIT
ncbi:MAG: hypothetical protein KAQ92_01420, partial [Candidatus Aenigmarchaeota archaeon]|nr:hypothetical protein [Candidatus Aenigmarchaeota archaeon]